LTDTKLKQLGIIASDNYWNASEEVRKIVSAGCGPNGWKVDIVPDRILFLSVKDACKIHDWMYREGITDKDKKYADVVFYLNMKNIINKKPWFNPKFLRLTRLEIARNYYRAVKVFGKVAFYKGK